MSVSVGREADSAHSRAVVFAPRQKSPCKHLLFKDCKIFRQEQGTELNKTNFKASFENLTEKESLSTHPIVEQPLPVSFFFLSLYLNIFREISSLTVKIKMQLKKRNLRLQSRALSVDRLELRLICRRKGSTVSAVKGTERILPPLFTLIEVVWGKFLMNPIQP